MFQAGSYGKRHGGPRPAHGARRLTLGPCHEPCNLGLWSLSSAHEPRKGTTRRGKGPWSSPRGREPAPLPQARATTVSCNPPSPPPRQTARPKTTEPRVDGPSHLQE